MSNTRHTILDEIEATAVPLLKISKATGIPVDRMYKWYKNNSKINGEDIVLLRKWLEESGFAVSEANHGYGNVPLKEKVKGHDALLSVLVHEVAALIAKQTGEPVQTIIKKLYKAAQDVGDDLPG